MTDAIRQDCQCSGNPVLHLLHVQDSRSLPSKESGKANKLYQIAKGNHGG